jgi:hypothetical protein
MPKHTNTKSPTATDRADFSGNSNRPAGNLSARELIADATAARTALTGPPAEAPVADEHRQAKKPRHRVQKHKNTEADETALAAGTLPTMGELEVARDDHSKRIAGQEADHRTEDADRKAGGER